MGAFDDLTATATDFGGQQQYLSTILSQFGETDIVNIMRAEAKALLLQDLQVALNRRPTVDEDMQDIDTVVEAQEPRLRRALATLQLRLVYERQNNGQPSKTYDYWKYYTTEYENQRRGFPGLIRRQGSIRVESVALRR